MPPFADLLQELVGADDRADAFPGRLVEGRFLQGRRRPIKETAELFLRGEQLIEMLAKLRLLATCLVQVRCPLGGVTNIQCGGEDGTLVHDKYLNALCLRCSP